ELKRWSDGPRGVVAPLGGAAFHPDGRRLATTRGALRPGLRLWDATTSERTLAVDSLIGAGHAVAFGPSGRRLETTDDRGGLPVRDLIDDQPVWRLPQREGIYICSLLAFLDGGAKLLAVHGRDVTVNDAASGNVLRRFATEATAPVAAIALSTDRLLTIDR